MRLKREIENWELIFKNSESYKYGLPWNATWFTYNDIGFQFLFSVSSNLYVVDISRNI